MEAVIDVRNERPARAFHAALRRWRRAAPAARTAPDRTGDGHHPLRVADVMRRAGLTYLPGSDGEYRTACPQCGAAQTLADATVEPAGDPDGITAYRCCNGCTVLATIGHPPASANGCGWRFTVGELVITALVPAGLQFTTRAADR